MSDVDVQPSISSEEFLRTGRDVRISNQPGFLCKVRMKALIDVPPEELFLLLTSENNASVFSSIDRTIKRDILSETANERFVYLEQAATVGALMFKKHFTTACYVTEYIDKLSADFSLAKPGIMASFQGHWSLTPVTPEAYEKLSAERKPQEPWEKDLVSSSGKPDGTVPASATSASTMKTLMYLDQDVGPAAARKVPPMFHGILRRMCASAAVDVFKDLTVVAALRQKGVPLDTLLQSRVHGRGGLKRGLLGKGRHSCDHTQGNPLDDKDFLMNGDAASSVMSSPIRSFACDCSDIMDHDHHADTLPMHHPLPQHLPSSSTSPGPLQMLRGPSSSTLPSSALPSPRVVLGGGLSGTAPAPTEALRSFKILDFDDFAEDDPVE